MTTARGLEAYPARALIDVAEDDACVVVMGLQDVDPACWSLLTEAGIELVRVNDVAAAIDALLDPTAHVVIAARGARAGADGGRPRATRAGVGARRRVRRARFPA